MPRKKYARQNLDGLAAKKSDTFILNPASAYLFYRVLRAREASVRSPVYRFGSSDM